MREKDSEGEIRVREERRKLQTAIYLNSPLIVLFIQNQVSMFQLQKCGKKLDELHTSYKELYQSAFDADQQTLVNIQMYPFELSNIGLMAF